MKNLPLYKFLPLAVATVIAGLSMGSASGQAAKVTGDKPVFDDFLSPEFSGGKQKPFKPKEWLDIEVKLKVLMSPVPKSKTCEKITVKWYVAVKNPEKVGSILLLTKDIEYVNVPLDQEIYCSVYLSPSSIKRLTGVERAGKRSVECVGYEVFVNGEKKAENSEGKEVGWWNATSEKISKNDSVPLLNKNETPFRDMWWDRYAEISDTRASK